MNRSIVRAFTTQITPLPLPTADFTGRVVIVTGANSGIGRAAAQHFVHLNARKVILGCRDLEKGERAKDDIERAEGRNDVLEVWRVDLGSFDSVKEFCSRAADLDRLDVVVENAGLLAFRHELFEGYERQTTVNVISTFLMALLLLPHLRRTRAKDVESGRDDLLPHLVIVGSNGHFYTPFQQRHEPLIFESLRGDSHMVFRYYTTKLISVMVVRALASQIPLDKEPVVILNNVDPGYCQSDLLRERSFPAPVMWMMGIADKVLARTAEMGARTYVMAATAGPQSHGRYLEDCQLSTENPFVNTKEGENVQMKVFEELMTILQRIQPEVSDCLDDTRTRTRGFGTPDFM
ncbi:short-chain dehydrogenase/reductase-like protein [Xylaria telfairii]|nr:short-chain dehydrogenase/reductase-like protein [Xylaria telfairii]